MSTGDAERAELLRERVRRLIPDILAESARADRRLETAERLLPLVLADATAAGFRPRVELDLYEDRGIALSVWYAPGRGGGSTRGNAWETADSEPEILAGIADGVQEATMEGDQIHCRVWPVCADHGLGGHAVVAEGRAVWWCSGATGHVIAPVGGLAPGLR